MLISGLPNATPQKTDKIELQRGLTSSNNTEIGQLMQLSASENLAPAYDPNAGTYEVGDFVSYDGTLYQCNTAISTPETFDATKWDAVKVTELSSGASVIQLTQAEYTALSTAEKMNGSIYKLTDKAIFYCLDEEYHPVKELNSAQYEALTTAEQNNGTIYIQTDKETTGSDIAVSDTDATSIAEAIGAFKFLDVSETVPASLIQWGGVYGCDLTFDISSLGLTTPPRFVGIVKGNTPYNWMINITGYTASSVSVMLHRGTNSGGGTQFVGTLFIVE